ncbi:MAG: LPS-assembly protein LptD [Rickettsiales bacterium]
MRTRFFILACACLCPLVGLQAAALQKNRPGLYLDDPGAVVGREVKRSSDDPVTLEADEVGYDQDHAIVVARGHVQLLQSATILTADQLTYYQKSDLVVAEGNVSILEPSGDVYFADTITLQQSFKRGTAEALKIRLADNSVLVSSQGRRLNAAVTKLDDASYTPCSLCQYTHPFWQLNADSITLNTIDNEVSYDNATLDILGVPVAYTPFLVHPLSDTVAKSGFLTPQYSNDGNLGTLVKVPYYWRIAPDKDLRITPWYVGNNLGPLLELDYRQFTDSGEYHFRGSGTDPTQLDANGNRISGNDFRGHVFADGVENLTDYSRIGFKIQRSTDDTYLRRYRFGDQQALFSRAYFEAAQNRNFALVQALAIQGLRLTDDPATTPLVLPSLRGYYETDPLDSGLRFHASADAQSLTRDQGVNQQRFSGSFGASIPYVDESGVVVTATANLRQDIYHTEDILIDNGTRNFSGDTYRALPQLALEWRYPLINQLGTDAWTVEPMALVVGQTNGNNPQTISNEDNRLIELTDSNLFSLERQPGLDQVDSGSRVAYGLRSQYLFADSSSIDLLFGQNYNFTGNTPFPNSTTPGGNFSDYIGRLAYRVAPLTLTYRFALDNRNLNLNRTELGATYANTGGYVLDIAYRSLDNNRYLTNSEEGVINGVLPFSDSWSIYGGARRDFVLNRMTYARGGIIYKNECFNLMFDTSRIFSIDRDLQPSTAYTVTVGFKNLGEFGGR